jgi:hypothetical protein
MNLIGTPVEGESSPEGLRRMAAGPAPSAVPRSWVLRDVDLGHGGGEGAKAEVSVPIY